MVLHYCIRYDLLKKKQHPTQLYKENVVAFHVTNKIYELLLRLSIEKHLLVLPSLCIGTRTGEMYDNNNVIL